MDGRLPNSRLPDDDDPWVWVEGRELVVSSSSGLAAPGEWVGIHINALPDAPIAGEFEFRITLAEIDELGTPLGVLEERSVQTRIPTEVTDLLDTHLPMKSPAYYRIAVGVTSDGFEAEVRSYITVPPAILEAELVASRTRVGPGETLPFTVVNLGPTPLFYGVDYELERSSNGVWVNCNVEEAWIALGLTLEPGAEREEAATIPEHATPGRYRITKTLGAIGTNLSRTLVFEAEVADEP